MENPFTPIPPLVFHHHLITEGFLLRRHTKHKYKNVSHTHLQPWLKVLLSVCPSMHRCNGGYTFRFHLWRRRHDSLNYLRLLASGRTVALCKPSSSCLLKNHTRHDIIRIKTHIVCATLFFLYASRLPQQSLHTFHPSVVITWCNSQAPSMCSCCYHLTIQRSIAVVIAVVLPRSFF